ncbi:uncharacterized protein EI97DRAFT_435314 [Westerdykella ornata]|uniref:Uncharacterized protein n=1 Tax=Westerdykella ornata TaxID=318751 RepID=A0A6A6JCC0_WESOR|nr:uncharacterized protein EI97DRAFT_435314 [Westerdykella ornata]KAF2274211.1 hypothetical protein EI97DRAFT_435314 [Westerdykella ornata]
MAQPTTHPTPSQQSYPITPTPYPAKTTTATAPVHGVSTTATCVSFADKILITVTQEGKLGHWMHIPLSISPTDDPFPSSSSTFSSTSSNQNTLLPHPHLTATTILGGTHPTLSLLGQTLATQIASAILTRNPHERRMVVVGLGLDPRMEEGGGRDAFADLVGLMLGVI